MIEYIIVNSTNNLVCARFEAESGLQAREIKRKMLLIDECYRLYTAGNLNKDKPSE